MAWTPLDIGRMRSLIRIEAKQRTPNGRGGFGTDWVAVDEVWAEKIPLRGDEITRDSVLRSVKMTRFVVHYRDDVTTEHRLIEDPSGMVWNVRRVEDPYGRSDRLELDCESGVMV